MFSKCKPKYPSSSRRRSLMQLQGFLVSEGPIDPIFLDKRFKVHVTADPIKTHYRRPSVAVTQIDAIKEIKEFYEKSANHRGKVVAKDIYEALSKKIEYKEFSSEFYKHFKTKLYSEISFEEMQASLFMRGRRRFKTLSNLPENKEIPEMYPKDLVLKNLFIKYDLNKDGLLTQRELRRALKEFLTEETINSIFNEYDISGEKKLTFDEFHKIFQTAG